jgi:hypothetical protein
MSRPVVGGRVVADVPRDVLDDAPQPDHQSPSSSRSSSRSTDCGSTSGCHVGKPKAWKIGGASGSAMPSDLDPRVSGRWTRRLATLPLGLLGRGDLRVVTVAEADEVAPLVTGRTLRTETVDVMHVGRRDAALGAVRKGAEERGSCPPPLLVVAAAMGRGATTVLLARMTRAPCPIGQGRAAKLGAVTESWHGGLDLGGLVTRGKVGSRPRLADLFSSSTVRAYGSRGRLDPVPPRTSEQACLSALLGRLVPQEQQTPKERTSIRRAD